MIFDYPELRPHRRHGPRGYARYESYRPWLRDEFAFRCVYCLKRERWGHVTGEFDLDHFQPQVLRPGLANDYANLSYACRRCNTVKSDHPVDDPFVVMCQPRVATRRDGTIYGLDERASRLILALDLNSPRLVQWRVMWMRIVDLAAERDPGLLAQLTQFPDDLPKLDRLRPPGGNGRAEGIEESWAALAIRGALPACY